MVAMRQPSAAIEVSHSKILNSAICGAGESIKTSTRVEDDVFPLASSAKKSTVVVPSLKFKNNSHAPALETVVDAVVVAPLKTYSARKVELSSAVPSKVIA